ncbi:unnamed protein product [Toxocara canis]|uniref:GRIP domain-containing protein n=1 Tax=Toxocara canis TaxID=6265 RepID=A0A183UHS4_TOXCA|nr:unnamed protein product [Toxocara canis]
MVKQLLDRDKEKDERLSFLNEEILQKTKEIQHLEALLKSRDKYMEECENDMVHLTKELDEAKSHRKAFVSDLEKRMFDLRELLSVKCSELSNLENEKARVEKNLAEKERELEEVQRRNVHEESANITTDSLMDAEIIRLTHKTEELEQELYGATSEIEQLQRELIEKSRELENEQARCEEINAVCNEYKRDAEEVRLRNAELTAELDDHRNNVKMAKKGNSMFAEFVDERLKLEKDLIKLKSENDWLRDAKRNLDRELECMRQQLLVALALPSSNGGGDVSALQTEISELRVELGLAKEKLANLYAEAPVLLNRNVQHAGKMFNDVFMRTLSEENARLKEKITDLQRERCDLFDQCTESSCRMANEARRRKELEAEVKSLHMQLEIARTSKRPQFTAQAKECLMERVENVQDYANVGESLIALSESSHMPDVSKTTSYTSSNKNVIGTPKVRSDELKGDYVVEDTEANMTIINDENQQPLKRQSSEENRLEGNDGDGACGEYK